MPSSPRSWPACAARSGSWWSGSRGLAIRRALALAGAADSVLVAGKGQETTQDFGELKVRFSDRAQVVQALREWTGGRL